MKNKSAIIPYRHVDNELQILLIKNLDNTKWVIPKGTIEKPLKPSISATKEAYEEAGVLGIPHPILVGTYYKNNQNVPTYLLEVIVELSNYEEDNDRESLAQY
jgi:8-oxo-dGTP pyrophosphatase MutT (NUDIX family)